MRLEVGPLPPDPMLEAIDRTRAASCPASSRWVVAVRGRVVDERGAALEGAFVQPCLLLGGTDRRVCLRPSTSDADGVLTAILPEENRCVDEVALRILVPMVQPRADVLKPRRGRSGRWRRRRGFG